jgi:hypothetical protein
MTVLQHRQHLRSQPVAAEALVGVAGVEPQGQLPFAAEATGVAPLEEKQRSHQLGARSLVIAVR